MVIFHSYVSLPEGNGRYNELVHGGYFMVYKPTSNWGAPSCTTSQNGNPLDFSENPWEWNVDVHVIQTSL